MDFIIEIPKSKDFTCIMVIVDRLTKVTHFIPFCCLPMASIDSDAFLSSIFLSSIFLSSIFLSHSLPESIISQFTSAIWNKF